MEARWSRCTEPCSAPRPIAVLLVWVWAKPQHVQKYIDLVNRCGWDVLVFSWPTLAMWVPFWATRNACHVLRTISQELQERGDRPVVFYVFSGAAKGVYYQLLQLLASPGARRPELKPACSRVRACCVGQIFDSCPVDFTSEAGRRLVQPRGPGAAAALGRAAASVAAGTLDFLFLELFEAGRSDMWSALANPAIRGPCLFLYSRRDELAESQKIASLAAQLRAKGRQVLEQVWHDTPHVGHLAAHPTEYGDCVTYLLQQALLEWGQRRGRGAAERPALAGGSAAGGPGGVAGPLGAGPGGAGTDAGAEDGSQGGQGLAWRTVFRGSGVGVDGGAGAQPAPHAARLPQDERVAWRGAWLPPGERAAASALVGPANGTAVGGGEACSARDAWGGPGRVDGSATDSGSALPAAPAACKLGEAGTRAAAAPVLTMQPTRGSIRRSAPPPAAGQPAAAAAVAARGGGSGPGPASCSAPPGLASDAPPPSHEVARLLRRCAAAAAAVDGSAVLGCRCSRRECACAELLAVASGCVSMGFDAALAHSLRSMHRRVLEQQQAAGGGQPGPAVEPAALAAPARTRAGGSPGAAPPRAGPASGAAATASGAAATASGAAATASGAAATASGGLQALRQQVWVQVARLRSRL